jgi:hypothetical protein
MVNEFISVGWRDPAQGGRAHVVPRSSKLVDDDPRAWLLDLVPGHREVRRLVRQENHGHGARLEKVIAVPNNSVSPSGSILRTCPSWDPPDR